MEYLLNKIKKYKYKYLRMTGGLYIIPSDKIIPTRLVDIADKDLLIRIQDIVRMKLETNRQYLDRIVLLRGIIKEIVPDRNYIMRLGQNKLYMNELRTLKNLLLSDELVKKYERLLVDMKSSEIVRLYYKNGILINID